MTLSQLSLLLGILLKVFSAYFLIITLFALKRKKEYPVCAPKTRFAILIAARNEEMVIGQLIDSLQHQKYPKRLFSIYVIPNNCQDHTEEVAVQHGAKILHCLNPVRCKGDALRQAMEALEDSTDIDAYCIFDADNVADKNYLSELNRAFQAGAKVVKARTEAHNRSASWVAGSYGLYFSIFNVFYNRARAACGLSAKLIGTAFAVRQDVIAQLGGWHTSTIAEDAEFAAQLAQAGIRVWWAPNAVAYDEEPNSFFVSLSQRKRWCSGIMQVSRQKLPDLMRSIRGEHKGLTLDFCMFLLAPYMQVASLLPMLLSFLLMLTNGSMQPQNLALYLIGYAALSYCAFVLGGYLLGRMTDKKDKHLWITALLFPIFMASWLPLQVLALFHKTTSWRQIEHTGIPAKEAA